MHFEVQQSLSQVLKVLVNARKQFVQSSTPTIIKNFFRNLHQACPATIPSRGREALPRRGREACEGAGSRSSRQTVPRPCREESPRAREGSRPDPS